tara:strand:- start:789 stop:3011 length:2223 start_codon:yes stop_codon:yes gene_type:complete
MNTPKDISTVIHITFGIGLLLVIVSAAIPIINNKKSDAFKNYTNNISESMKKMKNNAGSNMKSSGIRFKDFIKSLLNNKWNKIGGGIAGGLGIILTILNQFNITDILNHKIHPVADGTINLLLLGVIGFFTTPVLKAGFDPNGPHLWHSILLLFFALIIIIIVFYSKELNIFLNPSTYKANVTLNRILTYIFAIVVLASVIIGVFIWSKNPSNHARGTSQMPTVGSDGKSKATFTSQTGWLLSEMKNYLFILCGVGLIVAVLFAIILFSTTNTGARYVPYIIMFVCGTVLGTILYLYLRTVGKPILDKLSKFPIFKLLYHILFLIPCFFLDIVNNIYTELKGTPKIAYTLFAIEMIVILLFISGPLITSHLYKHHPNTNIDIMKQTLKTEENTAKQDILIKREEIKKIKRYGLFKKNWLSTGSKFWDKLLHKNWYKIGTENPTPLRDTENNNKMVACNPNFVNFFRINFAGPPGDNSDLLKHWKYVSEDDKSGGKKMGAALRIIRLQQEIKDLEQRLIQIEKEKLSNDGFAMTKVLRMQPTKTNHKQLISTYKDIYTNEAMPSPLYEKGNFDYALSVWTFFHSISPESTIDKYYRIISYGNKPGIYFNPIKRKLAITLGIESQMKQNNVINYNGEKQIILGVIKNIKLQRWNNLVINCNNGVLDIFINGKLNTSYNLDFRNNPFLGNDSVIVGEDNGLDSGICNIVFFSTHISKTKIQTLYENLKDKDPPVVFDLDSFFK